MRLNRYIGVVVVVMVVVVVVVVVFVFVSCQRQVPYPVDIYYICSTDVISSQDENGNEVYNATLTQAEKELLDQETEYMREQWGDSINWFAPYYHQFTMNAIALSEDSFQLAFQTALADIQEQFTYYLKHQNRHRPFFLVGFSQGAMFIPYLLDSMRDRDYNRCLGAYMMGYRLSQEDLLLHHIEPATSATEGKLISYNTVCSVEQQWPFVSAGAATCINPLNWCTDATPATLYWQGDTITIYADTTSHLLIADADSSQYYLPQLGAWMQPGCLHHWDLLWYSESIKNNMRLRAHN